MLVLVPAEYKDSVTDVDASHYVSRDFFADGFLEYLPSGSRTKIESLVPVETYMCRKSGDVEAILLQFQMMVPAAGQRANLPSHLSSFRYRGTDQRTLLTDCLSLFPHSGPCLPP